MVEIDVNVEKEIFEEFSNDFINSQININRVEYRHILKRFRELRVYYDSSEQWFQSFKEFTEFLVFSYAYANSFIWRHHKNKKTLLLLKKLLQDELLHYYKLEKNNLWNVLMYYIHNKLIYFFIDKLKEGYEGVKTDTFKDTIKEILFDYVNEIKKLKERDSSNYNLEYKKALYLICENQFNGGHELLLKKEHLPYFIDDLISYKKEDLCKIKEEFLNKQTTFSTYKKAFNNFVNTYKKDQYKERIKCYKEMIEISKKANEYYYIVSSYSNLIDIYIKAKDFNEATSNCNELISIQLDANDNNIHETFEKLAEIYKSQKIKQKTINIFYKNKKREIFSLLNELINKYKLLYEKEPMKFNKNYITLLKSLLYFKVNNLDKDEIRLLILQVRYKVFRLTPDKEGKNANYLYARDLDEYSQEFIDEKKYEEAAKVLNAYIRSLNPNRRRDYNFIEKFEERYKLTQEKLQLNQPLIINRVEEIDEEEEYLYYSRLYTYR